MRLVQLFFVLFWVALIQAQTPAGLRSRRITPQEAAIVEKGARIALLVGVGDYDPQISGLRALQYPVADIDGVARLLSKDGYSVRMLTDRAASAGAIRQNLRELKKAVQPGEGTFLFMYSGHGGRLNQENYLATFGSTAATLTETGLSLTELQALLQATGAKQRIAFIDACRDDPSSKGTAAIVPIRDTRASEGLRILYSTASGDVSYEDDSLQHGIFSHFLIEGLSGKAANPQDHLITFGDLNSYVTEAMRKYGTNRHGGVQIPYESGESSGDFLVATFDPKLLLTPSPAVSPMTMMPAPAPGTASAAKMKMSRLTANVTLQPEGSPSIQLSLSMTPNAGGKTYTAGLMGSMTANYLDGTASEDGKTFTFTAVGPGIAPFTMPGGYYTPGSGSLKLVLTPNSAISGGAMATGSLAGAMILVANPYEAPRKRPGAPTTPANTRPVTVSGQMNGTYFASLVPDTPGSTEITAPPVAVPSNADSYSAKLGGAGLPSVPPEKCITPCSSKIGAFKLAARYTYTDARYPGMRCEEKVYRLPDDWPGKPFFHTAACKGLSNGKPVTMLAFHLAATDRVHDSDITIPYDGMIGNGRIPNFLEGRSWHGPWRVKIFGEGDVETMTMEVTLAR
jgi:Caspase domain